MRVCSECDKSKIMNYIMYSCSKKKRSPEDRLIYPSENLHLDLPDAPSHNGGKLSEMLVVAMNPSHPGIDFHPGSLDELLPQYGLSNPIWRDIKPHYLHRSFNSGLYVNVLSIRHDALQIATLRSTDQDLMRCVPSMSPKQCLKVGNEARQRLSGRLASVGSIEFKRGGGRPLNFPRQYCFTYTMLHPGVNYPNYFFPWEKTLRDPARYTRGGLWETLGVR
uniref:Uncharacterized protein n=1 Tax=Timema douglasi TaxID=61478 RepID=A0A7R8VK48_TIMDO|nr:unnamed protein product [Timema douglasi]